MSLNDLRRMAEEMKQEYLAHPDRPATFYDLAQAFAAMEMVLRETSNRLDAMKRELNNKTDPRLYMPSGRDR